MAQYNITIDSEILHYLFLKGAKDEGMAKLLESVLNQVLQAQATEQIKAEPYERTKEREDYRNGYYKRGRIRHKSWEYSIADSQVQVWEIYN